MHSEGFKIIGLTRSIEKTEDLFKKHNIDNYQLLFFDHDRIEEVHSILDSIYKDNNPQHLIIYDGYHHLKPLRQESHDSILQMYKSNVSIPLIICKEFAKKVKQNKSPNKSITLMSSIAAIKGEPALVSYSASKGAIISAVKSMSRELAKDNIRVNSLCPGWIESDRTKKLRRIMSDSNLRRLESEYPLGLGDVNDTSSVISFLISDGSRWVTGQNIILDGGITS